MYQSYNTSPSGSASTFPMSMVNSIEEAKLSQVMPNSSAFFMDLNVPKFYVKTTDSMGRTSAFRVFSFTEEIQAPPQAADNNYVTQEQFASLESKIDELLKRGNRKDRTNNAQPNS